MVYVKLQILQFGSIPIDSSHPSFSSSSSQLSLDPADTLDFWLQTIATSPSTFMKVSETASYSFNFSVRGSLFRDARVQTSARVHILFSFIHILACSFF